MKFYHSFLSTPLMRFLEDFFGEAGRRGNVLALENGACSHCIQNITTFVWLCLQNYFDFVMFQIVLVLSATWLIMPQYLLCQMSPFFLIRSYVFSCSWCALFFVVVSHNTPTSAHPLLTKPLHQEFFSVFPFS